MLRTDGQPVIIDFGLARRFDNTETLLTLTGAIGGTPGYMAPEQITGAADDIGPPCDIYALGVVLYELLTGATPFSGNVATILGSIVSEPPPPLKMYCPNIEPVLDALCLRALEKSPNDRYRSAQEFAETIATYLAEGPEAVAAQVLPNPPPAPHIDVLETPASQPGAIRRVFGSLFGRE
jgi:serine/threonine-protein kinase